MSWDHGQSRGMFRRKRPALRAPSLVERAMRSGDATTRAALLYLIDLLDARTARRRVEVWLRAHPNRPATHEQIAAEVGLSRWTVTNAFGRLGIRCQGPRWKGTLAQRGR